MCGEWNRYSFGIVILETYTGQYPYSSPEYQDVNQVQLILQICVHGLRPDTSMLPPALRELVLDCLCVSNTF